MSAPLPPTSAVPQVSSFVDDDARDWEVRAIRDPLLPERRVRLLHPSYADGWLLFTSGVERRRLAPLPVGWQLASEAQLRAWCASATRVTDPSNRH
jgi:hypothetical protein